MADNFTQDNFQGVFGEFTFVIDETLPLTDDNVQGVFGEFVPVADEAASGVTPAAASVFFPQSHITKFSRQFYMFYPGVDLMQWRISKTTAAPGGRIMSSLVNAGGLSYSGGIAGKGGGLAG